MTISKQLVGLMGGRLWIESPAGKRDASSGPSDSDGEGWGPGTAIHFTGRFVIPESAPASSGVRDATTSASVEAHVTGDKERSLNILVAEDNRVNQTLMARLLGKMGHTATLVNNGREAVVSWKAARYDAILMDVQMPEMDGLEATRAIRAGETGEHIPIIAVTAHAVKGDHEQCLTAGMDAYLTKPLKREELEAALAKFIDAELQLE